jgi:hypothetical protein
MYDQMFEEEGVFKRAEASAAGFLKHVSNRWWGFAQIIPGWQRELPARWN